ncbi:N-terminal acetyltransferase [Nitzschia inconspicua]|uniref:N-terminal acetyltransferase n=1 Tax=Nitzschia inconspicua TaxID=303405 RepID=A0A9K3LFJ0_9STRA|nr:N-terminal acetyltransferase [Nitzschia inconspicua]
MSRHIEDFCTSLATWAYQRRRRNPIGRMLNVASLLVLILARAESFTGASRGKSTVFLSTHSQRTSYLNLVETEVACSPEELNVFSTPFTHVIHQQNPDQTNGRFCDEEKYVTDLSPAFSLHHTSMKDQGGVEEDSSESSAVGVDSAEETSEKGDSESMECSNHDNENSKDVSSDEVDKARRLEQISRAAFLQSQTQSPSRRHTSLAKNRTKTTSVGARRIGSATKAREGRRSMNTLVDAVRTGTSSSEKNTSGKLKSNNEPRKVDPSANLALGAPKNAATERLQSTVSLRSPGTTAESFISRAMIESTVHELWNASEPSIGLLGEAIYTPRVAPRPKPGTILVKSRRTLSSFADFSATSDLDVRVATPNDDLDIAQLRLSIFSDFTPQTQKMFCDRSCHLLSSRRQRGAVCIVATNQNRLPGEQIKIIGTAEISFHEFIGTRLGRARPKDSILYLTEVAVNTKHRRKGIASLMMEAIEKVAKNRDAETIYLHVDITNLGALTLYEKAGFKKLPGDNLIFKEFTTKLNLHDGATKGRRHFLMSKDLKSPTWLEDIETMHRPIRGQQQGTLGIEVRQ